MLSKKFFWSDKRKFLGLPMRFARGDVTTSFQAKTTTDPRIGAMEPCSDRVGQTRLSRDFWRCSIFDFFDSIGQTLHGIHRWAALEVRFGPKTDLIPKGCSGCIHCDAQKLP